MMFVLDITVNFMLNKRKSKKAAGASLLISYPDPTARKHYRNWIPLCDNAYVQLGLDTKLDPVTGGATPPPVLSPNSEYIYRTPLSQNPGSAPALSERSLVPRLNCM